MNIIKGGQIRKIIEKKQKKIKKFISEGKLFLLIKK